jgi:hypothetical protein
MMRRARLLAVAVTVVGLVAASGFAFAPPDDKGQNPKAESNGNPSKGKKQHKDFSGKALLGDNIKKNGNHKLQDHGTYSASVNVSKGKITGMNVKHSDRGSVPVTKYKTTKNMAEGPASGIQFASYYYAQSQYIGSIWIGYGYVDEWGDEYVYWFPYDMIFDGDTGAIEYYPAY